MNNNIEQLNTQQQQDNNNFQDVDFSFTSLAKETQEARDQALFNNLSGAPVIPETPTTNEIQASVDTPEISDSFTTRDEVMARLGLMKEDYTYSDTYTNYINQGGSPLPGYETAHTQILAQEKAEALFKQEEEGLIDHDTALIEAYGRDILATMGYDVTSVAYWQNKFMNDDFSHPFHNRYLMDQVLTAAEEYKKTKEASEWANSQVSNTQIASLVGEELSTQQVKQIFGDLGTYAREQQVTDEDLMRQILSGSIGATNRLRQISDTQYAYLHTDGKLYVLEKGKDIKFNAQGQPTEISVNGSDIGDFLDHFASAFMSIVPGVVKLGHFIESIPQLVGGDVDALTDRLQRTDEYFNSKSMLSELYRIDHMDLDGFQLTDAKDISMLVADITGMMAGAKVSSAFQGLGQSLYSSASGIWKAPAWAIKEATSLGARSTGWYSGLEHPEVFQLFGKAVTTPSKTGMWLNTILKVNSIYAMKDFNQSVQAMNQANISLMIQGKEAAFTENDVFSRAIRVSLINSCINALLASSNGLTMGERLGLNKQSPTWARIFTGNAKYQKKLLDKLQNDKLRSYLTTKGIIGFNSFADVFATVAGNQIQAYETATTKDGKAYKGSLTQFLAGDDELGGEYSHGLILRTSFWKDVIQTGIRQIPEYRRNKVQSNIYVIPFMKNIKAIGSDILNGMDEAINKYDGEEKEKAILIKNDMLTYLNAQDTKKSAEERILGMLDHICEMRGDMPRFLQKILDKNIAHANQSHFKDMKQIIDDGLEYFNENAKAQKLDLAGAKDGLGLLKFNARERLYNYFGGKVSENSKEAKFLDSWDKFTHNTIRYFYLAVGETKAEKAVYNLTATPEKIDMSDAIKIVDNVDVPNKNGYDKSLYTVYRLKEEAEYGTNDLESPRFKGKIFKSTMEVMAQEMPDAVVKVDDNTFAVLDTMDPIMTMTEITAQANITHSLFSLKDNPTLAATTIVTTLMGDTDFASENTPVDEYYNKLVKVINVAVDNKLIDKWEATQIFYELQNNVDVTNPDVVALQKKIAVYLEDNVYKSGSSQNTDSVIKKSLKIRRAIEDVIFAEGNAKDNAINNLIDVNSTTSKLLPDANEMIDQAIAHGAIEKGYKEKLIKIINTQKSSFSLELAQIDELLNTKVNDEGAKVNRTEDEEIALYSKVGEGKEKVKTYLVERAEGENLPERVQNLKDYDETTVNKNVSGTKVVIDLSGLGGEQLNKLKNQIEAKQRAKIENKQVDFENIAPNVEAIQETKVKSELAQDYNSTVIAFDLSDPDQFKEFLQVAKKLNLFGDMFNYETVSKEDVTDKIKGLKNGWENDVEFNDGLRRTLKLEDKLQDEIREKIKHVDWTQFAPTEKTYYTKDGKKTNVYDLKTKVKQATRLQGISPKMLKRKGTKKDKEGNTTFLDVLIHPIKTLRKGTQSYVGSEEEQYMEGTAKAATGLRTQSIIKEYVQAMDDYEIDQDLATYFYLRNIIENATPRNFIFSYVVDNKEGYIKLLQEHGIIGDNGFFEVSTINPKENVLTIVLKQNAKDKMIKYLDSSGEDFNVFKILPLFSNKEHEILSYESAQKNEGKFTYTNKNGELVTVNLPDMYNGQHTPEDTGLQAALNISAGFDQTGIIKSYIFGAMQSENLEDKWEFNPFISAKIASTVDDKQAIYDAYNSNDLETLKTYEDYEARYLANLLELENQYKIDSSDEDYKLLLQDENVADYLMSMWNTHTQKWKVDLDTLKENVKAIYIKNNKVNYSDQSSAISYNYEQPATSFRRQTSDPNAYSLNANVLEKISGNHYYVDLENNDIEYVDLIVDTALNKWEEISNINDNDILWNNPDYLAIAFTENNVARVLKGIYGNDGYIDVRDADEIANLTDDELNKLASILDISRDKVDRIKTMSERYLEIERKFIGSSKNVPREYREYTRSLRNPSLKLNADGTVSVDNTVTPLQADLFDHQQRKSKDIDRSSLADDYLRETKNKLVDAEDTYDDPNSFGMQYYAGEADKEIRKRFDNAGSAEIYNLHNGIGVEHMKEVRINTLNHINQIKNSNNEVLITNKDAKANMVEDMYYSALNTTDSNEWYKYKVYDADTGKELLNTVYSGYNYMELYSNIKKLENSGKNLLFVSLQRQDLEDYNGIRFGYTELTPDKFEDVKNYFIVRAFDEFRKREYSDKTYAEFRNDLLQIQETDPEGFNKIMVRMLSSQLSKKSQNDFIVKNIAEVLSQPEEYIKNSLLPSVLTSKRYGNEGIVNYVQVLGSNLDSNNPIEVANASLAIFGIDINSLSEDLVTDLRNSRENMLTSIKTELQSKHGITTMNQGLFESDFNEMVDDASKIATLNFKSDDFRLELEKMFTKIETENIPEWVFDKAQYIKDKKLAALKVIIASSPDASALAYRTSGVFFDTLRDTEKLEDISMPDFWVSTTSGADELISLKDIDVHNLILYDLEGMIPEAGKYMSTNDLGDIFQASFRWYVDDGNGNGHWETKTIFITHDGYDSPKAWAAAKGILDKDKNIENSYYKNEAGYKSAVDEYINPDTSIDKYMTEDEFKEFINSLVPEGSSKDFVAFNGDNYDFKYLQKYINNNTRFIDAYHFNDIVDVNDQLDAKTLEMLSKRDLDNLNAELKGNLEGGHNAEADTLVLQMWVENKLNTYKDPTISSKQRLVTVVDDYLKFAGFSDGEINEIYQNLDQTFRQLYERGLFDTKFRQGMVNSADTTYILRQLNHMKTESLGFVLRQFATDPSTFSSLGFEQYREDIINGTIKRNIVDAVAAKMLENPELTAYDALNYVEFDLLQQYKKDKEDENAYAPPLTLIRNFKVSDEVKNSEQFNFIKDQLNKKNQVYGSKYSFVSSPDAYQRNKQYGQAGYVIKATDDFLKGFKFDTEEMQKAFEDDKLTLLSSTKDGLEQFAVQKQLVANSKTAQKTFDMLRAGYSNLKGLMFTSKDGVFKKVLQRPTGTTDAFEVCEYDPNLHRFVNKGHQTINLDDASTLIMDKFAVAQMCRGQYDYSIADDGNLYVAVIRYPSTQRASKHYFKVQVVDGYRGDVYVAPIVWRTLFQGDFDGDAASIVPIDTNLSKKLAQFSTGKTYSALNIQENLYNTLTSPNDIFKTTKKNNLINYVQLAYNEDILNLEKSFDDTIKKSKGNITDEQYQTFRQQFINKVYDIVQEADEDFVNEAWNTIGIRRGKTVTYVRNFALLEDPTTYSYEKSLVPTIEAATEKDTGMESMSGQFKQVYLYPSIEVEGLNKSPLSYIDLFGSRIGEELVDVIDTIDWVKGKEKAVSTYFNSIIDTINKDQSLDNTYKFKLIESIREASKNISEQLNTSIAEHSSKPNDINEDTSMRVFSTTSQILQNVIYSLKDNKTLNDELGTILSTNDPDDRSLDQINQHLKFHQMYKDLTGNSINVGGDTLTYGNDQQLMELLETKIANNTETAKDTQFVKDIAALSPNSRCTVAVVDNKDFGKHNDTVLVQNNGKIKRVVDVIKVSKKDFEKLYNLPDLGNENEELSTVFKKLKNKNIVNLTEHEMNEILKKNGIEYTGKTIQQLKEAIIQKHTENKENRLLNIQNAFSTITYENKREYRDIIEDSDLNTKTKNALVNAIMNLQKGQTIEIASNLSEDKKYQIIIKEPIQGMKVQSIAKGTAQGFTGGQYGENDQVDCIISNKMLSKLDKISPGAHLGTYAGEADISYTWNNDNHEKEHVRIFKDVPIYLLENFNPNVEGKLQKTSLMEQENNPLTFTELGEEGSIFVTKDGDYVNYSNGVFHKLVEDERNSHDISWANGAGLELRGRVLALKRYIVNNGLLPRLNTYLKEECGSKVQFNSGVDIERFMSHFSPASLYMYDISEVFTEFLNKAGYARETLWNSFTDQEKQCFSRYVQSIVDQQLYGDIWDTDHVWITSKSNARSNVAPFRKLERGERINPRQEDFSGREAYVTTEFFYMPMNKVFENHNDGFGINRQSAVDMTGNGILSYNKHLPAYYAKGFAPIADERYSTPIPDYAVKYPAINDPKSGIKLEQNRNSYLPNAGEVFRIGTDVSSNGYYVDTNKHRGQLNVAYATNDRSIINNLKRYEKDGLLVNSLINNDEYIDALIESSDRNIASDIVFNAYTQKERYGDEGPELSLITDTRKGSFSYLNGRGKGFNLGRKNYYGYKDVINPMTEGFELKDNIPEKVKVNAKMDTWGLNKYVKKGIANIGIRNYANTNINIPLSYGKDNVDVFKNSWLQSSGIHIGLRDQGDTMAIAQAIENSYGESNQIIADGDEYLTNIRLSVRQYSNEVFQDYCTYEGLYTLLARGETETFEEMLHYIGKTRDYFNTTMKQNHDMLDSNTDFKNAMDTYIKYRTNLNNLVYKLYDDPFANMSFNFLSFVPGSKYKNITEKKVKNAITNTLEFKQYDAYDYNHKLKEDMMFDFFNANKSMHREVAKLISTEYVTEALHRRSLLDNSSLLDKSFEYLDSNFNIGKFRPDKAKNPMDVTEIHNTIVGVVREKLDVNVQDVLDRAGSGEGDQIKALWRVTKTRVNELQSEVKEIMSGEEDSVVSYSKLNKALQDPRLTVVQRDTIQKTFDAMTAEIILAQRIMELSPQVAENVNEYFNSVIKQGYVFVNKQGQKLSRDSVIRPIGDTDTSWMVENIEKAANSQSGSKFTQYLLEKILRGEAFLCKQDLADQLEQKYYTKKVDGKFMSFLKKISSTSAAIQMAMPLKMMSRVLRFTGTDYALGATYSFKTIPNMARAARELSAAIYSKGASLHEGDDLYEYLKLEGQPLNSTNKDPITFQESIPENIGKITDILTQPLAYQNHLGRYAIWLTAKESFDNGEPIYGPTYYLHNQIDSLTKLDSEGNVVPDNASKAMFVMDHMLGSPAGFPYLSKKTNGLMMFATFPMNLTRTFGAYGMSLGVLFKEGVTEDNAPQWMRSVASPSANVILLGALGTALISAMCDKYGIDEKTKKKWIEEQVAIDPLATFIGGTPSVTYDSLNPYNQLKEMFINPWTSEYNKNLGDKALGFLSQNVLSKLNPAIKTPAELLMQRDFANGSTIDTSKNYTWYENGMRKMLGFMVGSGVASGVIDQFKIDSSDKDSNFINTFVKGLTNGFANDLGNQKSWKKDTSNYYAMITKLSNYKWATSDFTPAEYEDLTDLNYLKKQRNYSKSYGDYDKEDYSRVNAMLKKMIKNKEKPSTVYAYIAEEYNNGTSEATLRRALNNNSIVRMINSISKKDFYRTLSSKELQNLEKALAWEQKAYPLLKDFFPANTNYSYKLPSRKKYYNSGGSSTYYPKVTYPKKAPTPTNGGGYSTNKYSSYKNRYNPERYEVNVSPQMGVWVNDYDKVTDLKHWTNNTYQKQKPLNHGGGK